MKCQVKGCYNEPCKKHEIWYGTANRKISLEYGLQIDVCAFCHLCCHSRILGIGMFSPLEGKSKYEIQKIFCDILGVDTDRTRRAVLGSYKAENKEYLENLKLGKKNGMGEKRKILD